MAAALLRGPALMCVRCLHRELCRVVWRPQSAFFSSKPSDRKQPRRTHIKKAKPQPPIDIAKLLEKLFSQRRPGTTPPAGAAAQSAKASSTSTKPPTSSVKGSTSNVPPLSKPGTSVFPSSSFKQAVSNQTAFNTAQLFPQTNPKTSFSSESHLQSNPNVVQASAAEGLSSATVYATSASSSASLQPEEPAAEAKTVETAAEPIHLVSVEPPVEPLETRTSVVEGPVKPSIDAAVNNASQELQTSTKDSGTVDILYATRVEPLIETTIESPVESSLPLVEQLETRAPVVEGPADPTVDAAAAQEAKSADSGLADAKEEPSKETTTEPPVDATVSQEASKAEALTLESVTLSEVEAEVGHLESEVLQETCDMLEKEADDLAKVEKMEVKTTAEEAAMFETQAELLTVDSISEAADAIKAETSMLMEAMFGSEQGPKQPTEAPLQEVRPGDETTVQVVETESTSVLEAMSLESVTLAEVEASLGTLGSESLSETTSYLEKEAEILVEEEKMEVKMTTKDDSILEDETETKLLTVDSISEAADAIEAETAVLMEAMLGSEQGPKQPTDVPLQKLGPQDETILHESDKESLNVLEAMSLESVTLAEVEASLGTLGSESLSETTSYLEKEAEILAGEEKMEVKMTEQDAAMFETEAELLTVDSISEAADAIKAETAVLMEAMFGSEQGPKQLIDAPLQEVRQQDKTLSQEADKESLNVLEAMSLESVTLAEVEASLGTLGSESLSETTSYLEKEAEILAGEEKVEVKMTAENVDIFETEAELSTVDSISEATDAIEAETSVLMEAMFGSGQGPADASRQDLGPRDEATTQEAETESTSVLEAMSLESVTLAEVEASLGTLGSESLSETTSYLEKEAEILAGEEKMEVKTTEGDVAILEDDTEAELLTGSSISEAADAIEAETAVLMEAMFGSEQGPKQPTEAPLQDLGPRDETAGQEAVKDSTQEGVNVLEAMSLESVTLAEVEASLGTLGGESLSETTSYLEKEAEILAGEEKMEADEGTASKEATEVLNLDLLSLPDAGTEDLQTDSLMEELLFAVPQHTTWETGRQTGPEVVGANSLDAAVPDTVTEETAESPPPPVLKEVLLEEEVEEVKEEEAKGTEEDTVMHTDLDPVQRLFLEKIREYKNLRRLSGGLLEAEPDYIKHLSEETLKLQRLYGGGGDLTDFPQFTFTEPELDQDSK